MNPLATLGRTVGYVCMAIGGLQLIGGTRVEPGMNGADPTVDSHVRFMGSVFIAYGLAWVSVGSAPQPDVTRMRLLAGLMAAGGVGRLITRATIGRPHRFHDVLLATELTAPLVVEVVARRRP